MPSGSSPPVDRAMLRVVFAGVLGLILIGLNPDGESDAPGAWPVTFTDVAAQWGLAHSTMYGGVERKRFIIETNGSGVALVDVDNDGWLDALVLSGTRLKEGERQDAEFAAADAPTNRLYRQPRGWPLRRHNGTRRPSADGLGLRRVRRRLRQRWLDGPVRDVLRTERALSEPWRRPVRGRDARCGAVRERACGGAPAARSSTSIATAGSICSSRTTSGST